MISIREESPKVDETVIRGNIDEGKELTESVSPHTVTFFPVKQGDLKRTVNILFFLFGTVKKSRTNKII